MVGGAWGDVWGNRGWWWEELGDERFGVFFVTSGGNLSWGCVHVLLISSFEAVCDPFFLFLVDPSF